MSTEPTPEKKLVIDEDWKSQVEAEKEAARYAAEQPKQPEPAAKTSPETSAETSKGGRVPLPPADLTFLIGTLYIQGAMALGLLPNPMTKKAGIQPDQAKHSIDLLTVLQEKTEGNRTPQESGELEAVLHELRMAYITVQQK